jgi:hypothetical protein
MTTELELFFIALAFGMSEGGLAPGERVECTSHAAAIKLAEKLSQKYGNRGAIAFFQQRKKGSTVSGFDDAVLMRRFGEVPSDLGAFFNAERAWDVT